MPYEPFEKGVDPGLQAWLRMRLAAREAQLAGGNKTVVIRDVPYKYYKPWIVNFFELPGCEVEKIMRKDDREMWNYSASLAMEPPAIYPPLTVTGIFHTNLSSMSMEEMELFVNRIMEDRTVVFLETLLSHPQFSILQRIGSHRRTLLHIACGLGDVDKVTVLLNNQCKVNVADTEGLTPLHYCMHPAEEVMHSEALVQLLLKQKASINICDQRLRSPLHYACILQSDVLVLLLLQKGADLAILDSFEKFPLDYLRHVITIAVCTFVFCFQRLVSCSCTGRCAQYSSEVFL
jgi:hypothetical protein